MGRTTKLTVSLPEDLVDFADRRAREQKTSRSKVVAACLREIAQKQFEADMIEGYKAMAKENLEWAEMAIQIAHETLP